MHGEPAVGSLIPHAGTMCLLERIVAWDDDTIRLATSTHRSPANPLRSGEVLRAIHLCEYGAQAMAVHGGLLERRAGQQARPGFLVLLRDVELHVAFVHDLPHDLIVEAQRVLADAGTWQYAFEVRHEDRVLARGRATVAAAPDATQP